jgi:hypothetical protein
MKFSEPLEFSEALDQARNRGLLPTTANSAQIAEWEDELKRLSVFSARTNHAGYLQDIKDKVLGLLGGEYNEATARAALQDLLDSLGYTPERGFPQSEIDNLQSAIPPAERGSLRDLSSNKRAQLVLRTQMRQMANRGYREQGNTPAALFAFPAWELVRIYPRAVPREDWPERWIAAGGKLYEERMIGAKNDPAWIMLGSRELFDDAIGTDYPPFAFNSGMGWRQVSRAVCEKLGVNVGGASAPRPAPPLDDVQVAAKFDPEFLRELRKQLDIEISDGVAKLKR